MLFDIFLYSSQRDTTLFQEGSKIINTDRIAEMSQSYQNSTSTHRRYNPFVIA